MTDTAENITPDQFPEVPPTKYLSFKMFRAQARQINRVQEAQGGHISGNQLTMRQRLFRKWDKLPAVNKISILEDLLHLGLSLALVVCVASPAMAGEPLTAYDKFDKPSIALKDDNPFSPPDLIALVHSYEPIKGKKVFYYRDADGLYWDTTKRIKRCNKHKVRDLREDAVIHPKYERWRKRIVFYGPGWSFLTDQAVKGAVGYGAAGGFN